MTSHVALHEWWYHWKTERERDIERERERDIEREKEWDRRRGKEKERERHKQRAGAKIWSGRHLGLLEVLESPLHAPRFVPQGDQELLLLLNLLLQRLHLPLGHRGVVRVLVRAARRERDNALRCGPVAKTANCSSFYWLPLNLCPRGLLDSIFLVRRHVCISGRLIEVGIPLGSQTE